MDVLKFNMKMSMWDYEIILGGNVFHCSVQKSVANPQDRSEKSLSILIH